MLTKQQTQIIRNEITQKGISDPELGEDLLDHICTAVETEMAAGESFEQAYKQVMRRFGRNELRQVEQKTQALVNKRNIYYPNILQSFVLLVVYIILTFFFGLLISPIQKGDPDFFNEHVVLIQSIQVCGSLLLVILIAKLELKEASFTKVDILPHQPFPLSIFPLILGIVFLGLIWINAALSFIPLSEGYQAMINQRLPYYKPIPTLLFIGIVWPVLTEVLFRGIILKGLLRKYKPFAAIVCSGIFYAVSLLNPYSMLSLFLLGLFSGWLFYRTHSLIPSILAIIFIQMPDLVHIVWGKPQHFNELLILKNLIGNDPLYYSLAVVSFLITLFLIWRLKKILDQQLPIPQFSLE